MSFAIGTCSRCRETRLNASYFRAGKEDQICRRCKLGKQGLSTEENNAIPIWRDAAGVAHYDVTGALSCLTLAEWLLIALLSVTVTIHHLSHGGVASWGHVATLPKPVEPMADVLPRPHPKLPSSASDAGLPRGMQKNKTAFTPFSHPGFWRRFTG